MIISLVTEISNHPVFYVSENVFFILSDSLLGAHTKKGFPGGTSGKESACQCKRPGFDPWVRKIPWRREGLPTSVLRPGEFHGERSLAGYTPWGRKELDMTERLTLSLHFQINGVVPLENPTEFKSSLQQGERLVMPKRSKSQ